MRKKAGFTLIEIMVSLVLVGLIASIAGTLVITATRGYLYARENDAITQKAQLALGRLNREFTELMDVKARGDAQPYLIYEVPLRTGGVERRGIAKVGDTVQMFFKVPGATLSGLTGYILVDNVQTLSLMYNPSSGVSLWSMGQDIRNLYAVSAQIVINRPDTGGSVSFFTTVSPRNNNNSGGAALPSAANPPPEYSGRQCFVTTAAYGDADHPVVVVLRQFRDRFLLPTDPGKALVRCYYDIGPSLAAAIEDRPLACLLVRFLVTPVAGFALLSLSCPVMIPLILLLSWGLAHLILEALRRRNLSWRTRLRGQRGAMLVTLITAMVVFAALGAVMIGMFGTAALSQAAGNYSQRAYYLAESGLRYAAGTYVNVAGASEAVREDERNRLLKVEFHNREFKLGSNANDGKFRLDVYPYYYVVPSNLAGSNELITETPGGLPLPASNYEKGGWVRIKKQNDPNPVYVQLSQTQDTALVGTNTVKFYCQTGSSNCPWPAGTDMEKAVITPVCKASLTAPIVSRVEDGKTVYDLAIQNKTGAGIFPEKNGAVIVTDGSSDLRLLNYKKLDVDADRLRNISDPDGKPLPAVQAGSNVSLSKFIRLESTGTFGAGTSAVSRKVTYFAPIGYAGATPTPRSPFHDKMLDFSNWLTGDDISRTGTLRAGTSYGTTMRVDSTQAVYTLPGGSCLKMREFQTGLNLSVAKLASGAFVYPAIQQEWLRAGDYLSYDLEMKTFYTLPNPLARFAFGLTFRLDEEGNALGFSLSRGVPGDDAGCDRDGIPFELSGYPDSTPFLVFWMKQYAKKEIGPAFVMSTHSVTPVKYDDPPPLDTATYAILTAKAESFWQNGDRVRFVNNGGSLPAGITGGRDYYIRKVITGGLTYLYLFDSVTNALNTSTPFWTGLQDITALGSGTTTIITQDPAFTKLAHQVMNTGNGYYNLMGSLSFVKSFVTLTVRVVESPSVSFVNGGGASGRRILNGETVYQTSSNLPGGPIRAVYRVARNPFYRESSTSARNWAGNAAQGVLVLERLQGNSASDPSTSPFTAGSKIFVGDHPGGTWAATVGVPGGYTDQPFRTRDNWMLFYVGDPTGNDPPDANPFNNFRGPVLRNSVLWPPDNVEDAVVNNDKFTLLRFSDYINTTYCTSFGSEYNLGSGGDVLRFTSPDGSMFYSPQSEVTFPTKRSEVGLHAYGLDAHYTEFDDFALQFGPGYGITRTGFLLPIQQ